MVCQSTNIQKIRSCVKMRFIHIKIKYLQANLYITDYQHINKTSPEIRQKFSTIQAKLFITSQ